MLSASRLLCVTACLLAVACKASEAEEDTDYPPKNQHDDTGGDTDDTGGPDDTAGDDTGQQGLPADPTPFTLTVTGSTDLSLVFDETYCTQPMGSSNFSQYWRNSAGDHVFLIAVQLLGTYEGAGTYTSGEHGAKVKLQEEAGGELRYFYSDSSDTVEMTIEHIDKEQAWGDFTFSGLHDSGGASVTVSPLPVPIWCPAVD